MDEGVSRMREIKFRAITDNGQFIYGFLLPGGKISGKWYIVTNTNTYEIDIRTLGQYTGLKDKNGNEIYEGDIVIHHYFHETGTVIWQQSQSRYALEYLSDKKTQELFPIDTAMFEIIGNIYEHPHLLNAKESTEKGTDNA